MLEAAAAATNTSPTPALGLHQAPTISDVITTKGHLLLLDAPIPALGAPVARGPRSKASPAEAMRKSARTKGTSDGPVLERAIRATADKNNLAKSVIETATPSSSTPAPGNSSSTAGFVAFQDSSLDHLLKVANDSCILFKSTEGSPAQAVALLQARERAQAELLAARHRLEEEEAKAKEEAVRDATTQGTTGSGPEAGSKGEPPSAPRVCGLAPSSWGEEARVSEEENVDLACTFCESELEAIIKEMKTDTVPGPNGFPVAFFKRFWPQVKLGILHILNDFVLGRIDIVRLNFGILSLIPKVPGAEQISQYRPIALINVIFKIISKAYASKLDPIAHRILSPNQTAFIKGRNILDGPLALMEIIHDIRKRKHSGVLLKLDFEKAYDGVNWDFLGEVLRCKGGIKHLKYADDTLILIQGSDEDIANLKFLLMCFEDMSGLKINYHKSEVFVLGQ
ncbi:hypothetical protein QYE76_010918 [Lolium multiflorum]|uniref:Reverse transcriptase domain-containing protein n=1 Tax=Lolium multiflorum TaxID=4521 RepID=A0AAD8TUI3_LOLMU|nr:hypothetical protein QYE76_010918 [Lolium multiflorum]